MIDDYNSISTVKLNISTNEKEESLNEVLKKLFVSKIQPYILEKANTIDKDITISIDLFEIEIPPLEVSDIKNISNDELDKIVSYFKDQFDKKLASFYPRKINQENKITIIQKVLSNGYVPYTLNTLVEKFNIKNQIVGLSRYDTRLLLSSIQNHNNKHVIIKRLLQQLNHSEIEVIFNKIGFNYKIIYEELKIFMIENKGYFPFLNAHWSKNILKYILSNKIDSNLNPKVIIHGLIDSDFQININYFRNIKKYEKLLSKSNINLRNKYYKKRYKSYNQVLKSLINNFKKEKNKLALSSEEAILQFQNFLLIKSNRDKSLSNLLDDFLKLHKNKKSNNFSNKEEDFYEFSEFIKSGSLSVKSNYILENEAKTILLNFVSNKPYEIRKGLLDKQRKVLWYLISKFSNKDYEYFIHQLSPNFLFTKKVILQFFEELAQKKILRISNLNELSLEFNVYALETLVFKKEIHFKLPNELITKWLEIKKISKGIQFKSYKWSKTPNSEIEKQLINILLNFERDVKIKPKNETVVKEEFGVDEENYKNPTYYINLLSYYILFNKIPWWAKIYFEQLDSNKITVFRDILTQFKSEFRVNYFNFLDSIKQSKQLLESLIYRTNSSVSNYLIRDLIDVENITQINLFIDDLSSICVNLFSSNLYKNQLQNDIYFSVLSRVKIPSLDSIFDELLYVLTNSDSLDFIKSTNSISNINFQSNYFLTISFYDRLKLINSKKNDVRDFSKNKFSIEHILQKQLINDLILYFKTGILKGLFSSNMLTYVDFISELLKDQKNRQVIISELRQSILNPIYFLITNQIISEKRIKADTVLRININSSKPKGELVDNYFLNPSIGNQIINIVKGFDKSELAQLNINDDDSIQTKLRYHKKSPELNIAVLKYFFLNDDFPWWSPFENSYKFQQQFMSCFTKNSNFFLNEIAILFTNSELRKSLVSFFSFKLNESFANIKLEVLAINELEELLIEKWKVNENFLSIYSQFLSLKILLNDTISLENQTEIISAFLNYAISYLCSYMFIDIKEFIISVNEFKNLISNRFNVDLMIEESIQSVEKIERDQINLNSEEIDLIDRKMYNQLLNQQIFENTNDDNKTALLLLAIKPLLKLEEYRFLQECHMMVQTQFLSKEKTADITNKIFHQTLKLVHHLITRSEKYSVDDFWEELDKKSQKLSWANDIKSKLDSINEYSEKKQAFLLSNTIDLKTILIEKFSKDNVTRFLKVFNELSIYEQIDEVNDLNTTFLTFMYYLAIESQKEIRPLILSFFRLKSISKTSIYPVLMNVNSEEKIKKFENTHSDLILNLEISFLINNIDLGELFNQSVLQLSALFKTFDSDKWDNNLLFFLLQQFSKIKGISLTDSFDFISEIVNKDPLFGHLRKLKILIKSFEKNDYYMLQQDTYSKTINNAKYLSKVSQRPEDLVSELMRQLKLNDQFFSEYKKYFQDQSLEKVNLSLHIKETLPEIKKGEQLQIYNSGLAIIWPFLGTLFTKLGYVEGSGFIDKSKQFRAVHLTQYLIDGGDTSPEFVLAFNKLICGLPLSDPLDMFVILTKQEKEEANQFLASIKNKWKEMKNTSIDTFRESFLQREGILIFDEKNWKLQVQNKPIDVLLRKLPWGISLIKFRWNDYIIFVEWTTKN